MSICLDALICCHVIDWLALTSSLTSNEVFSECISKMYLEIFGSLTLTHIFSLVGGTLLEEKWK